MNTLFLEDGTPPFLHRAKEFARRQKGQCTIVFSYTPSDLGLAPEMLTKPLGEIYPDADRISRRTLDEIMVILRKDIDKMVPWPPMREALDKAFRLCLVHVSRSLAFAKHLGTAQPLTIVSRWAGIHRRLQQQGYGVKATILPAYPKIHLLGRLGMIWLDGLAHVGRCAVNLTRRPRGRIAPAIVGFLGQFRTPLEMTKPVFANWDSGQIFFHIFQWIEPPSQEQRSGIAEVIRQIDTLGWKWWEYGDRNLLRAFGAFLRYLFASVRALLSPSELYVRIFILRTELLLEQQAWEFEDVLRKSKARVFIMQEERSPPGFLKAAIASKFGCKIVNLCSGILSADEALLRPPPLDAWALFGPYQREIYRSFHVPDERLFVTGHLNEATWIRLTQLRKNSTSKDKRRIVYFSQPAWGVTSDHRSIMFGILRETLEKLPSYELWIKPHPTETDGFIDKLWKDIPRVRLIDRRSSAHDLMADASIVVAVYSTTLLEALAAGIPIAVFNVSDWTNDFVKKGAALDLFNSPQPAAELAALCQDPQRLREMSEAAKTSLEHHVGPLDGKAHQRIAQVIEKLLSDQDRKLLYGSNKTPGDLGEVFPPPIRVGG